MATPLRLKSAELFFKYGMLGCPHPCHYIPQRPHLQVVPTKSTTYFYWSLRVLLVGLTTAMLVYKTGVHVQVSDKVGRIAYLASNALALPIVALYFANVHCYVFRRVEMASIYNAAIVMTKYLNRSFRMTCRQEYPAYHQFDLLGWILIGSVPATFGMYIVGLTTVLLDLDPFSVLVDLTSWHPYLKIVTRVLLAELVATEVWKLIMVLLIFCVIFLCVIQEVLSNMGGVQRHVKGRNDYKRSFIIRRYFKLHQMCKILVDQANDTFSLMLPTLVSMGMVIFVACNYGTIQLADKVPLVMYWTMPTLSTMTFIVGVILFPQACKICEDSEKFLRKSVDVVKGKYARRKIRSMQRVTLRIGRFFPCTRDTKIQFYCAMVNNSITANLI